MRRSEPITWDQMRVGLVLIVSLVLLGLCVLFVGQIGDVFSERYQLIALMESASGLRPGAPVQVAGRGVGQVERVEFITPEERGGSEVAVAVWLGVNVGVRDQIRRGSRARVRTQGLLGDRLIDIEPGSARFGDPGSGRHHRHGAGPELRRTPRPGGRGRPRSHAALERSLSNVGPRLERRGFARTPARRRGALRRPCRPQLEPRGRAGADRGRGRFAGPPARGSRAVRPSRVLDRTSRHGHGGAGSGRRHARASAGVGFPLPRARLIGNPGQLHPRGSSRAAKGRPDSSSATKLSTRNCSSWRWT